MSSAGSVSSGVSSLIQALSNTGSSSVTSVLSSSTVQSRLKSASSADVAHVSEQALHLQQANLLFGDSRSIQDSLQNAGATTPESLLLRAVAGKVSVAG